ncbi:lmo0937 family membrane protein [Patescibacteria group bacterium]|nr:lmo0937 family membrane protein [Patescibacteria group bacterium]
MLYTIAVVLVIMRALGLFFKVGGNIIHVLLVIAIISVLLRVIRGDKKPLL